MRLPVRPVHVILEEQQAVLCAWEGAGMWAIDFEVGLLF